MTNIEDKLIELVEKIESIKDSEERRMLVKKLDESGIIEGWVAQACIRGLEAEDDELADRICVCLGIE